MAQASEDGEAYEDLIARILERFPDRLRRRESRIARPGAHLASRTFGERLAKAGITFDKRRRFPRPRELKAGVAGLSPERIAELGVGLPAAPPHLQPDREIARLGYDFFTADPLLDVLRLARARAAEGGRLLYMDSHCGHALRALLLAQPRGRWLGVEATEEARAWAAAHVEGATFVAKPRQPPLAEADASFDGAVALDVVRQSAAEVRDDWLAELWRLIRPDGFMVAAAPGYAAIADLAVGRRLPAATLEAACRTLEADGRTVLSIDGEAQTYFADAAFLDFPMKEHWRLGPQFAGAGPAYSDLYLLKRRALPLSQAPPARKYVARAVGAAALVADRAPNRPWDRLVAAVRRPSVAPPKRFVVLAMHRSGSTMVVATLNSHPAILCHGELFRRSGDPTARLRASDVIEPRFHDMAYRRRHPEEYLDAVYGIGYDAAFVGFKLLSKQNVSMRDRLIEDERYVKILLRRDNVLARYSSDKVTRRIRLGTAKQGDRIAFVDEEFRTFHLNHDAFYADARDRLDAAGRPYLEITYVEACTPTGLRNIVAAIGADASAELRVPTAKRNSSDIVSRFSNPDDVTAYLLRNDLEQWREERIGQAAS